MTNLETNMNIKLPEPTLRRLPWYLAYVKLVQGKGAEYISSTQISKAINVDSSLLSIFRVRHGSVTKSIRW